MNRFFVTITAEVVADNVDAAPAVFARLLRDGYKSYDGSVEMTVENAETGEQDTFEGLYLHPDGEFRTYPDEEGE